MPAVLSLTVVVIEGTSNCFGVTLPVVDSNITVLSSDATPIFNLPPESVVILVPNNALVSLTHLLVELL